MMFSSAFPSLHLCCTGPLLVAWRYCLKALYNANVWQQKAKSSNATCSRANPPRRRPAPCCSWASTCAVLPASSRLTLLAAWWGDCTAKNPSTLTKRNPASLLQRLRFWCEDEYKGSLLVVYLLWRSVKIRFLKKGMLYLGGWIGR